MKIKLNIVERWNLNDKWRQFVSIKWLNKIFNGKLSNWEENKKIKLISIRYKLKALHSQNLHDMNQS